MRDPELCPDAPQQRILHRTALLDYVIAAETRNGQPLMLGDALGELLADIAEAARTIGTILQQVYGGPPWPTTAC